MTNFEKYKDEILKIANERAGRISVVNGVVKRCFCTSCDKCDFDNTHCDSDVLKWLYAEADEVDWSKVPVDTKVLVSRDGKTWAKRYFAKYEDGVVYTYLNGKTSFSVDSTDELFNFTFVRLYEERVNECTDYISNEESYPLCKGIGEERCHNCCLYENYEENHSPYQEE